MPNKIPYENKWERFNAAGEAILDEKDKEEFIKASVELSLTFASSNPDKLLDLYMRAKTQNAKSELAELTWLFFRERGEHEKGFFLLLDSLCSQQIGNEDVCAILKKHPFFSKIALTTSECDVIIAVMLDFLEESPPLEETSIADTYNDYFNYRLDRVNHVSAARILVVLHKYPATSKKAKNQILDKEDLVVGYSLADASIEHFISMTLKDYLLGRAK